MPFDPTTVAIVLVDDFGDELRELARTRQVWVADTRANRPRMMGVWQTARPPGSENSALFTWSGDPQAELPGRIRDVELHHGPLSQDPPYARVEVYGCGLGNEVRHLLDEIGFAIVDESSSGFVAERRMR